MLRSGGRERALARLGERNSSWRQRTPLSATVPFRTEVRYGVCPSFAVKRLADLEFRSGSHFSTQKPSSLPSQSFLQLFHNQNLQWSTKATRDLEMMMLLWLMSSSVMVCVCVSGGAASVQFSFFFKSLGGLIEKANRKITMFFAP